MSNTPTPGPSMDEYRASNAPGSGLSEREAILACPFCGDDGEKGRQIVTQMRYDERENPFPHRTDANNHYVWERDNRKPPENATFTRIICRCCGAMAPELNWQARAALASRSTEPGGEAAGIEKAARWVDDRREQFEREHGVIDPETGGMDFRQTAQHDYDAELFEIAEGIRALASTPPPISASKEAEPTGEQPVAQVSEVDGKKCVTFYSHDALYNTPLWTKLYDHPAPKEPK